MILTRSDNFVRGAHATYTISNEKMGGSFLPLTTEQARMLCNSYPTQLQIMSVCVGGDMNPRWIQCDSKEDFDYLLNLSSSIGGGSKIRFRLNLSKISIRK